MENKNNVRQPTPAEEYLMNFWVPAPGHTIYSPDYMPKGYEFDIIRIDKQYPEQAVIKNEIDQLEVVYLQDWYWAPKPKELDEILKGFGVKIYDDMLQRNQVFIQKPKTCEEYKKVIQNVRMYAYQDGVDVGKEYLKGTENAASRS